MSESLKIAQALEKLVEKTLADFDFGMDVLRLPNSVREPMWDAIGRRAAMKALECSRRVRP